jgi:hypothetical protein
MDDKKIVWETPNIIVLDITETLSDTTGPTTDGSLSGS